MSVEADYGALSLLPTAVVLALAIWSHRTIESVVAGAIVAYIIIHSGLCIILLGAVYPLAVIGGRIPLKEFSGASLPAQAVAFSSRSSLASLPPAVE